MSNQTITVPCGCGRCDKFVTITPGQFWATTYPDEIRAPDCPYLAERPEVERHPGYVVVDGIGVGR